MLYYDDRDYYNPENIDELYDDHQDDGEESSSEYVEVEYKDYYFNLSKDIDWLTLS